MVEAGDGAVYVLLRAAALNRTRRKCVQQCARTRDTRCLAFVRKVQYHGRVYWSVTQHLGAVMRRRLKGKVEQVIQSPGKGWYTSEVFRVLVGAARHHVPERVGGGMRAVLGCLKT